MAERRKNLLITAKWMLTNMPVARGYHGWVCLKCKVNFPKCYRQLWCTSVVNHLWWPWLFALSAQCQLVWLVSLSNATAFLHFSESKLFFSLQQIICGLVQICTPGTTVWPTGYLCLAVLSELEALIRFFWVASIFKRCFWKYGLKSS